MPVRLMTILLSAFLFAGAVPDRALEPEEVPESTGITDADSGSNPFSIAWISDTQGCAYHKGEYGKIAEWIAENREEFNIRYVVGTGDYVGKGTLSGQWDEFDSFVEGIGDIPNFFVAGNHDIENLEKNPAEALSRMDRITTKIPESQKYKDGIGKYELFSENGMDYIIIGLSYGYWTEEIEWAQGVLAQYPERKGIFLFHNFMAPSGSLLSQGGRLVKVIKKESGNARLALCGHIHGRGNKKIKLAGDGNHFLRAILYNYQGSREKRGAVRILTFHPETGKIEMNVYFPLKLKRRPYHEEYEMDFS